MPTLIPVQYVFYQYPSPVSPRIQEIAGHFDKTSISPKMPYSLHTEYSFTRRKLDSPLITRFPTLSTAHVNSIPQLWFNKAWAVEFVQFIRALVKENIPPEIIEVHPPFKDYCPSIAQFLSIYEVFEREIMTLFPNTKIVIENRSGSQYKKGKFLISSPEDLVELHRLIQARKLKLQIVLDVPQIFTTLNLNKTNFSRENIRSTLQSLAPIVPAVTGIHIWGHKSRPHQGNLNDYFENEELKKFFLQELFALLNDGKDRYFVPEVNSTTKDLQSIVKDFLEAGFEFA